MPRLRLVVWLIALMALIAPPGTTIHAMAAASHASSVDCPDHAAPPRDPCPSEGTAKHAAGTCCPWMSGTVAVPALPVSVEAPALRCPPEAASVRHLAGRLFTQDRPPPRA